MTPKKTTHAKSQSLLRVIGVFDSGRAAQYRYTVLFNQEVFPAGNYWSHAKYYLALGIKPNGDCIILEEFLRSKHLGKKIKYSELPETVRRTVRKMRSGGAIGFFYGNYGTKGSFKWSEIP